MKTVIVNGKPIEVLNSQYKSWMAKGDPINSEILWCDSQSKVNGGYFCTRDGGHTGNHVAAQYSNGTNVTIGLYAVWSNEDGDQ